MIKVSYISRVPPAQFEKSKNQLEQIKYNLKQSRALIESSSKEAENIKSQIERIECNADLATYADKAKYKKLIAKYNSLVSEHNENINKKKMLYKRYQAKHKEVNTIIDKFNKGEMGEEVNDIREEPISQNYTFFEYIKKTYQKKSFRFLGFVKTVPLATPAIDIEMGAYGLILLLLKQVGLIFAMPALWLLNKQ